jgi:hypothetical protein
MDYEVNETRLKIITSGIISRVTLIEFETRKELNEFLIELLKDTSAINY